MGILHYGNGQSFEFDDRTLAHLRSVVIGKLTLQESIAVTWDDDDRLRTIWLHPSIPVTFEFETTEHHHLNREWLTLLSHLANHQGGLVLEPEPAPESGSDH